MHSPGAAAAGPRLEFHDIVEETINAPRPVTERIVGPVGTTLVGSPNPDPTIVWIEVPEQARGVVALRVATIDGRFVTDIRFTAKPGLREWQRIELPTRTQESRDKRDPLLREYARANAAFIAYAATLEPADGHPGHILRLASARIDVNGLVPTLVLVKSDGAQSVGVQPYDRSGTALGKYRGCSQIKGRESFYYDYSCAVTFGELSDGVRISRLKDGDALDPIDVTFK